MYRFDSSPQVVSDQWILPLEDRLVLFRRQNFRVAYYSHRPNTSSFRYRAWNMANMLNKFCADVSASWFFGIDGIALEDVIKDADILIIHRSGYSSHLAELIRLCRINDTKVLFDIDDFIFEQSEIPMLLNTLDVVNRSETHLEDQDWEKWLGTAASMKLAAKMCDGIICTTEYLASKAELYLDLPVLVIPNFLSDDQYQYSHELFDLKNQNDFKRDSFFDIGYFSGTPSHNRDFAITVGAFDALLSERDDVRLNVVGFLDLPEYFVQKHSRNINRLPLTNYLDLQRLISKVEINIAPLQQNSFTHGKSELKFFDAAAVGIPTIASPTISMLSTIKHNKTGYFAENHEWHQRVSHLIDNFETDGFKVGITAKNWVDEIFTSSSQSTSAEQKLKSVLNW